MSEAWVRRNKMRDDGRFYEVGWTEEDAPISDETIHIVAAYSGSDEADAHRDRLAGELTARAALTALEGLANAADAVGVRFFDSDTLPPEVEAMQAATTLARAVLARDARRR